MNSISAKLPVFFFTHSGPPFFFQEDSGLKKMLLDLKKDYLDTKFKNEIQNIIIMSAHFGTKGKTLIQNTSSLKTIHDHGFNDYYDYQYSPKGFPELAKEISQLLQQNGIKADTTDQWGADHGIWLILGLLFPNPQQIPVVAISVDVKSGPENILHIGELLSQYRSKGSLIIGSGSATHNLRLYFDQRIKNRNELINQNIEFDKWTKNILLNTVALERRANILKYITHPYYNVSHPSDEHWYPILMSIGAAGDSKARQIWESYMGGLSEASYVFE